MARRFVPSCFTPTQIKLHFILKLLNLNCSLTVNKVKCFMLQLYLLVEKTRKLLRDLLKMTNFARKAHFIIVIGIHFNNVKT